MVGPGDATTEIRARTLRTVAAAAALFQLAVIVVYRQEMSAASLAVMAIFAVLHVVVASSPWRWLLATTVGSRTAAVYLLGVVGLSLASVATSADVDSEAFWFLVFTHIVAVLVLTRFQTAVLLLVSVVGYPLAAASGAGQTTTTTVIRMAVLVLSTTLLGMIVRHWQAALRRADEATRTAGRHARVLTTVAEATASLVDLDPESILDQVVSTGHGLGFDRLGFWMVDGDVFVLRASSAEVSPATFSPINRGVAGDVLRNPRTLVIDDYPSYEHASGAGLAIGLTSVVAAPVSCGGEVVGILAAGILDARILDAPMVRAVELLAATAGRALDVAARSEAEQRTVAELRRLDAMKDDFIATVSHEMRTPLAVILGALETVLGRDELPGHLRELLLQRAADNGIALKSVIETLLDVGRLDRGSLRYDPAPLRCDRLVAGVVERLGELVEEHRLTVSARPITALGDGELLARVVENLVTNAVRHTPAGTPVEVRTDVRGGLVQISVSDAGPGIPADDLARLGERFFRGGDPNTRGNRGVGLGLTLVSEILELHGSRLDVHSEVGGGATFSFSLELVEDAGEVGADAEVGADLSR